MKVNIINSVKQYFKKPHGTDRALNIIAGAAAITAFVCVGDFYTDFKQKEKADQDFVQQYNPEKYEELQERGVGHYTWTKAVSDTKDSLYIDSIARTNYAKGMQAVRDSIANANNK